jgi:hypothetical protein
MLENLDDFQLIINKKPSQELVYYNFLVDATKTIDCYLSQLSNSGSSLYKALFELLTTAGKKKDISVRIVTTINTENIGLAKQLARHFNVYHVDRTEGNFCIIDGVLYFCDIENSGHETNQCHRQLLSKHLSFVKLQQNLFENLLNHAIPARERIKEVERGIQREYIETIRDLSSISRILRERIETAGFDAQVLFATINSFYWAENDGIIDLLGDASSRGVKVRVLVKIDDEMMKETSKHKIKQRHDRINVNFIRQSLKSKITTFIIDQSFSLTIDVNDDDIKNNNFSQSNALATYSNSESTVLTDYSMFENLWIQAERERHHTIRQGYFEIFSGRKLKDEIYEKDWTLNEK